MLRVGTATDDPEPVGSLNPFLMERRIIGRDSASRLVLDRSGTASAIEPTHPPKQNSVLNENQSPDVAEVLDGNDEPVLPVKIFDGNDQSEIVIAEAGTRYCITDWIDASPTMWTAILSSCEMWYARMAGKPQDAAVKMFSRDLRIAFENDVVSPMSGQARRMPFQTPRSMGWHSQLEADVE